MLSRISVGGQASTIERKNETKPATEERKEEPEPIESKTVIWLYRDGTWKPTKDPPPCPDPLVFQSPIDLNFATSILYPGQMRGGDFKPHGGMRTDGARKPTEIKSPTEGYIWSVARFYDENGVHYMFDMQHPCGIRHRLGHLGSVPKKFEAIFNYTPENDFKDSRTIELKEPVFVEIGEIIATSTQEGTGFDWGVYASRRWKIRKNQRLLLNMTKRHTNL